MQVLWTEIYRPKKVSECILPERLKVPFQEYVESKEIPNLILSGTSGVGKTTVAKAMCNEVGCDFLVINGSDENGVDTVRNKIKNYASAMSLSGGRKVVIIDEADYLSVNAQAAFRNAIEEFSSNCSFIFTCNYVARIIDPLHSRCSVIDFSLQPSEKPEIAAMFFKHVIKILELENVEFSKKVLAEVIKKYFPDFRRTINELQRYSKVGSIDVGILSQVSGAVTKELLGFLKEKEFNNMRKWVGTHEIDYLKVYRELYDSFESNLEPTAIPHAIVLLADYQYKANFVADQEINLVACLTEIMSNCDFK